MGQHQVVLNGQAFFWENDSAGVSQGFVSSPLLFFIYINDIPERITPICKTFADDTSFFPISKKDELSQSNLNSDLKKKLVNGIISET